MNQFRVTGGGRM